MTRASIAIQTLSHGLEPSYSAIVAANDAKALWDVDAFAHVQNTDDENPITLTIVTNVTLDTDLLLPNRAVVVPAGGAVFLRPFARAVYRQTDGYVYLDVAADGLEIALLKP
jgi:hypothetical protein